MTDEIVIRPLCQVGETEMYVDANGDVYPCCWSVGESRPGGSFEKAYPNGTDLNLNHHTIDEILSSEAWTRLMFIVRTTSTAPSLCQRTCGADNNQGRPTRIMKVIEPDE